MNFTVYVIFCFDFLNLDCVRTKRGPEKWLVKLKDNVVTNLYPEFQKILTSPFLGLAYDYTLTIELLTLQCRFYGNTMPILKTRLCKQTSLINENAAIDLAVWFLIFQYLYVIRDKSWT